MKTKFLSKYITWRLIIFFLLIFLSGGCSPHRPSIIYDSNAEGFVVKDAQSDKLFSISVLDVSRDLHLWKILHLKKFSNKEFLLKYGEVPQGFEQTHPKLPQPPDPLTTDSSLIIVLTYRYDLLSGASESSYSYGFFRKNDEWHPYEVDHATMIIQPLWNSVEERDIFIKTVTDEMRLLKQSDRVTFLNVDIGINAKPNAHSILVKALMEYVHADSIEDAFIRLRALDGIALHKPWGITDLSILQDFPNLKTINIPYQDIEDITPISILPQLHSLKLQNNKIKDITPLLSFKKLQFVDVRGNPVTNMTVLDKLRDTGVDVHFGEGRLPDPREK